MTVNDQAAQSSLPRRVAGLPEYALEIRAQTAQNLRIFLPVAIVLLGVRVLFAFVQQGFQLTGSEVVIMALMLMLGGLWAMTRRGYVIAAAILLLPLTFIGMVFIASQANKIFDSLNRRQGRSSLKRDGLRSGILLVLPMTTISPARNRKIRKVARARNRRKTRDHGDGCGRSEAVTD